MPPELKRGTGGLGRGGGYGCRQPGCPSLDPDRMAVSLPQLHGIRPASVLLFNAAVSSKFQLNSAQ